jgi:predicted GNAT family acetyltransferase
MRPYFVLCAVVLMSVAAFGQQPGPRIYGPCLYGCGPYVPLVTTPMVSLQTVSPNPVGASNATTGLIAGATNATLSQIQGSTSSEYTEPVWYQGGDAPIMTSRIHLSREAMGHEGHAMREREEHGAGEESREGWLYFTGSEHRSSVAAASSAAKGFKKASRVYTNEDVERQNQANGTVKYGGKTEKM